MKKGKIKKALKPSQRESITPFASRFGSGISYEDKLIGRKIVRYVLIVLSIIALITIGYFVTEVILRITELPPTTAFILTKGSFLNGFYSL